MSDINLNARSVTDVLASDEIVANFFREEIVDITHHDSASISTAETSQRSPLSSLSRSLTRLSFDSVELAGVRHFSLAELCQFIADHPSLQTAVIVSCSCFATPSAFFLISHRFLIFQLQRHGRPDIWMRLDRRPSSNVGPSALSLNFGVTPSNDSAMLASSLENLLSPQSTRENKIVFIEPCLLSQLRLTLLDVIVVMDQYKLTSENCWAFCSLLQKDLFREGKAWFELGELRHSRLAQNASQRLVHRRLAPVLSPSDPSQYVPLSTLFEGLRRPNLRTYKERTLNIILNESIDLARDWGDSHGFSSLRGQQIACTLLISLSSMMLHLIYSRPESQVALQTTAFARQVSLCIGNSWTTTGRKISNIYNGLLYRHGGAHLRGKTRNPKKALPFFEEAASTLIPGIILNTHACEVHFQRTTILHDLGLVEAASAASLDFIECIRHEGEALPDRRHKMKELRARGIWHSKFDYLLYLDEGDVPEWEYWRQDEAGLQALISSPSSEPTIS